MRAVTTGSRSVFAGNVAVEEENLTLVEGTFGGLADVNSNRLITTVLGISQQFDPGSHARRRKERFHHNSYGNNCKSSVFAS